ncbi:MAG TPA: LytTR family DNA-binding domain-containing protein [Puia sp.]|nr:LytTR family DNA-binding domain-containing protein [Puia sp.]
MEPIKAILIDDELSSLQNLEQKITEFCPGVKVVATIERPEEALFLIRHHRPDVIFLDIEMPRMNGFRMLSELGNYNFEIIFTTAYNHYAVDAIRISAFDYLTKPVSIPDLQEAVNRLARSLNTRTKERLDILKQSLNDVSNPGNKIAVPTSEGLEFILIKDIVRIESSSNYSRIHFVKGAPILVTKQLKDFEEILFPYRFFRVHNSHLINLGYIRKYIRGEGGIVVMENGDEVDVSRRKKDDFLRLINQ